MTECRLSMPSVEYLLEAFGAVEGRFRVIGVAAAEFGLLARFRAG
jgi:hypothetical protein